VLPPRSAQHGRGSPWAIFIITASTKASSAVPLYGLAAIVFSPRMIAARTVDSVNGPHRRTVYHNGRQLFFGFGQHSSTSISQTSGWCVLIILGLWCSCTVQSVDYPFCDAAVHSFGGT
jgi:hypothetical protein